MADLDANLVYVFFIIMIEVNVFSKHNRFIGHLKSNIYFLFLYFFFWVLRASLLISDVLAHLEVSRGFKLRTSLFLAKCEKVTTLAKWFGGPGTLGKVFSALNPSSCSVYVILELDAWMGMAYYSLSGNVESTPFRAARTRTAKYDSCRRN